MDNDNAHPRYRRNLWNKSDPLQGLSKYRAKKRATLPLQTKSPEASPSSPHTSYLQHESNSSRTSPDLNPPCCTDHESGKMCGCTKSELTMQRREPLWIGKSQQIRSLLQRSQAAGSTGGSIRTPSMHYPSLLFHPMVPSLFMLCLKDRVYPHIKDHPEYHGLPYPTTFLMTQCHLCVESVGFEYVSAYRKGAGYRQQVGNTFLVKPKIRYKRIPQRYTKQTDPDNPFHDYIGRDVTFNWYERLSVANSFTPDPVNDLGYGVLEAYMLSDEEKEKLKVKIPKETWTDLYPLMPWNSLFRKFDLRWFEARNKCNGQAFKPVLKDPPGIGMSATGEDGKPIFPKSRWLDFDIRFQNNSPGLCNDILGFQTQFTQLIWFPKGADRNNNQEAKALLVPPGMRVDTLTPEYKTKYPKKFEPKFEKIMKGKKFKKLY